MPIVVEDVLAEIDSQLTSYARRMAGQDWEDAAQEARIVAMRAVDSFDADAGVPLGAWAWLRAKGAVVDYLRVHGSARRSHVVSIEDQLIEQGEQCHDYDAVEARLVLRHIAARCSPSEVETLTLAASGLTQSEIAARRGVTESRVSKTMSSIRQRIAGPVPPPEPVIELEVATEPSASMPEPATCYVQPERFRDETLSAEQLQIVQALADGLTLVEIAKQQMHSLDSIKSRLKVIANRLGVHTAGQLPIVVACMRAGLID